MTQETDPSRTFSVCDQNDNRHEVHEFTVFNVSNAGGIPRRTPADKFYRTASGENVGHQGHNLFQLPGSQDWLAEC
jgi:hypothetical protein